MILNSVLKGSRKLFPDQNKDRRGTEQRMLQMLQKHRQNDREVTRIEEGCAHGFFCFFFILLPAADQIQPTSLCHYSGNFPQSVKK